MDVKIIGGTALSGEITPSGSKNSIVAILPATLLVRGRTTIENVPEISDVARMVKIMTKLGSVVDWDKSASKLSIETTNASFDAMTKEDLGSMKGTSLLWGAMLGRFKSVRFDELPGGCTLGARPVDAHYDAFRSLGVKVTEKAAGIEMDASGARPARVWLTEMSPTATSNVVMLAAVLDGETTIIGAASEPSTQDLCHFLVQCGVEISGIGSNVLKVTGGKQLNGVTYRVLSDHIEIATFLALSACTKGTVKVHQALPEYFTQINREFAKFGIDIGYDGDTAVAQWVNGIRTQHGALGTTLVRAQPWPALPVDIMPLFVPLALRVEEGTTLFHNWMYESALFWTSELQKFGVHSILCDPHRVLVYGGNPLAGAVVEAPYIIRATVALVMAALMAEGESIVRNADTLHRGHPHFIENLRSLGAQIEEV